MNNEILKCVQDSVKIVFDNNTNGSISFSTSFLFTVHNKETLKDDLKNLIKIEYLNINDNEYSITEKGLEYLTNN